jgi:hypothetical protein
MTISFLRILSGLTGFVLLAMPASAAARDHRGPTYQAPPHATGQPVAVRMAPPVTVRPASFVETHRSRPAHAPATYNPPPRYTQPPMHVLPPREHLGRPTTGAVALPPAPAVQLLPRGPSPAWWTNTDYDEDEAPRPRKWRSHHEADRDDYPAQVCDEDGDDCRPAPQYRCDEDGDDCEYYGESYAPRYRAYGPQSGSGVPSYYRGRPDLLTQRQQLIAQLDYAQAQFHAARASGDRKLSARWATYIKNLNHSLAALDARAAGAAYNIPGYMVPPPPVPASQYSYPAAVYPYASYPNATGYGANPYGTSPVSGVMSSLLGPLLGSGQIP